MRGDADQPHLGIRAARGRVASVILVLHGGAQHGTDAVRGWALPYLRMVPFARIAHRADPTRATEVRLLRNRVRGWNAPALHPVRDARWAIERIAADHPGTPVALIGHSMGGRVALRIADHPAVTGVCALAPWTPASELVAPIAGKTLVIAHGVRDRVTMPADSLAYARRASGNAAVVRFEIAGEGHRMLGRPTVWSKIVSSFVRDSIRAPVQGDLLTLAWERDQADRLTVRV
jgi:dienelactone hydrolase